MALVERKEFGVDLTVADSALLSVLLSVARHSAGVSYGATRDTIWAERVSANVDYDPISIAISEAVRHGFIVAEEHQTGTAGSMTTYYKLAPQCSVELVVKIATPVT